MIVGTPEESVMAPVPPNTTVPVLVNDVPANVSVTGLDGENVSVPLPLTVPLFVNVPLNVCGTAPAANEAPFATVNVPLTVYSCPGVIPPLLLTVTLASVGAVMSASVGETVPLKKTVPVEVNPEFIAMV